MNFDINYLKSGIKKVVGVHLFSILITAFLTFFVPKFIETYDYGLWQLYVFYFGYIGFFHLGWVDGLYLNLLGKKYNELNKNSLRNEAIVYFIFQLLVSIIFVLFSFCINDIDKAIIIRLLAITLLVTNFRFFFVYILQACGKVKEYSNIQLVERILIVAFFIIFVYINKSFVSIILADIFSKTVSLFLGLYYCNDILICKFISFKNVLHNAVTNIKDGSKLMIANIASMLTTGIIKYAIEREYGVVEFGKVALSLTFSNLCVSILNSMGIVFIPLIKSKNDDISKKIYDNLHLIINLLTFFAMIFYYPIKIIASNFLPKYQESFTYLSLTFPIMYFCCLQALLLTTYIKALRQEKDMMNINIITIIFSVIYIFVSIYIFESFVLCVLGLTIVYFVKVTLYEYIVTKRIKSNMYVKYLIESIVMCGCFSASNYLLKNIYGMIAYIFIFIIYFFVNFNSIKKIGKLLMLFNK